MNMNGNVCVSEQQQHDVKSFIMKIDLLDITSAIPEVIFI
jgi:hypothetical protein